MSGQVQTKKPRETVVRLGTRQSLTAIATQPTLPAEGVKPFLVLILNAGIIHRVGPNRLHVQLARALAAKGVIAVRIDLSGIGDSERRADETEPLRAALADIREAIEGLAARFKTDRFVLVGLCSGADHAVIYAGSDPRVAGVVLLDPSVSRTRGYFARYYGRRLIDPSTWAAIVSGRHRIWRSIGRRLRGDTGSSASVASGTDGRAAAEQESAAFRADHPADTPEGKALLDRSYTDTLSGGRPMLAIFTSGLPGRHNYRTQLLDALPHVRFGSQLQLEYLENTEHTFDTVQSRERLVQLVDAWLDLI